MQQTSISRSAPASTIPDDSPQGWATLRWVQSHPKSVLGLLLCLLAMQITPAFKPNPDGVNYMSIARNLALHGRLERLGSTHLHYAPGYALAIAPAFLVSQTPFVLIGVIHLALCALLAWAIYSWMAGIDRSGAVLVAGVVLVSPEMWNLFRQASAEMLFLPAMMASVLLMRRSLNAQTGAGAFWWTLGAAGMTGFTCGVRQIGVFLAAGFFAALLWRVWQGKIPLRRAILSGTTVLAVALAVTLGLMLLDKLGSAHANSPDETYLQLMSPAAKSVAGNLLEGFRREIFAVGRLFIPGMWKTYSRPGSWVNLNMLIYATVCVVIGIGWFRLFGLGDPLVMTAPFYLAFCMVWPIDTGTRLTFPMLPVLAASLWLAFRGLGMLRGNLFIALIVIQAVVSTGFWMVDASRVRKAFKEWPTMVAVAEKIGPGTEGVAVRDLPDDPWLFLMYELDRQVPTLEKSDPLAASTHYVVTWQTAPDEVGFQSVDSVADLKIERRLPATGE
jgi:hypothetical protein